MQNVIKIVLLALVLQVSSYAKEAELETSFSFVGMSMDYREYDSSGNILDSEKSEFSDLVGVDIGLSYLLTSSSQSSTRLETSLMILGGDTDYVGSLLNDPACNTYGCYKSRTVNSVIDFDIGVKNTHKMNRDFAIYYALGLGYRYWERALSASQVEEYIWYSLRGNLGFNYQVSKKFRFGGEFEYQYGFNETMDASNLGKTFDLASSNIIKFSVPLVYTYTDKMDFIFEYIYTEQTIKESNHIVIGSFEYWEPDSTAKNQYIKVGVDFKF